MRILFTFAGGAGHLLPLLPFARALTSRGHEVAFSGQESMLAAVRAEGYVGIDSGGATLADPLARGPLLPVDRDREERVIRDGFAGRVATERAARLTAVITSWSPDVIVRDEVDFGSAIAAESAGIPHAAVIVLAAGGLIRPDLVAEPLDVLRSAHRLPPDPDLEALHRYLTLVPVPPSFRSPSDPLPATARHVRPAVLEVDSPPTDRDLGLLDWLARTRGPIVYFTLGTVFPQESGDLFTLVLDGLSQLDASVIATVGRDVDPRELGRHADHVRIERFVSQQMVLPRCHLVVTHGGSGSVVAALAFGLPLVVLPMGADQPLNADRAQALGVAAVLDPTAATSRQISRTAVQILSSTTHLDCARKLQREIEALPTVDQVVSMIEQLAAARP